MDLLATLTLHSVLDLGDIHHHLVLLSHLHYPFTDHNSIKGKIIFRNPILHFLVLKVLLVLDIPFEVVLHHHHLLELVDSHGVIGMDKKDKMKDSCMKLIQIIG